MSREVDNYPRALKHHATRKEVTVSFLLMREQQQRAQKAAAALHEMLARPRQAIPPSVGLSQDLTRQQDALEAIGGLDRALAQHQDALAAAAALGAGLARYRAALTAAGGLSRIIERHQLGLEVAAEFRPALVVDPEVRGGQPCLQDTRMTVYDVLEYLSGDMSDAEILDDFPYLTPAHLDLCRAFAAALELRLAALAEQ